MYYKKNSKKTNPVKDGIISFQERTKENPDLIPPSPLHKKCKYIVRKMF